MRVKNVRTGETGVVVYTPRDCPHFHVAPDSDPRSTVCWPKSDCFVVRNPKPLPVTYPF